MKELAQRLRADLTEAIKKRNGDLGIMLQAHLKYLSGTQEFVDEWNKLTPK